METISNRPVIDYLDFLNVMRNQLILLSKSENPPKSINDRIIECEIEINKILGRYDKTI